MRRKGFLMEQIADPDNLRLAFWKARKGKAHTYEVEMYRRYLDENLLAMREELLSGDVEVGNYRYFTVYEPKERLICAAAFRERVLHHALMNICHPYFENFQISDSYATRVGKGQYAALDKARANTYKFKWFSKLDVRKYFASIEHDLLFEKLCRKFKDPLLLRVFRQIIDSYESVSGCGLPVGNLASQYFANFYLAHSDHYLKEVMRMSAYVRYMDDMVMWHNDKKLLVERTEQLNEYISRELHLTLRPFCINRVDKGLPFLGYVLSPKQVRLNRNSKKRFVTKMKKYHDKLEKGHWSAKEFVTHVTPLVAFTRYAAARNLRRKLITGLEADC